jgi:hypothetical protein
MLVFVSIASLAVVIWGIIDVARRPAMVLAPKMEGTLDCWDDRRVVPLRDHRSSCLGLLLGRTAEAIERWPILQSVLEPKRDEVDKCRLGRAGSPAQCPPSLTPSMSAAAIDT